MTSFKCDVLTVVIHSYNTALLSGDTTNRDLVTSYKRKEGSVDEQFKSRWICSFCVLCSPKFNSPSTLVNSQLVRLLSVGILLNLIMFNLNYLFH